MSSSSFAKTKSKQSLFVLNFIFKERNEVVLLSWTYIANSGVEKFF